MKESRFPAKGSCLLRSGRWSSPGNSYFVTSSTFDHVPIFVDPACCQIVFNSIDWLEDGKRLECYCSVIMPEHVHLVIELGPEQTLSRVMQSLKGYTANKINDLRGRRGRVWQDQYYDHLVRTEEEMMSVILYCYENPVRRSLVEKASDYPFWRCKFDMSNGRG